MGFSFARTPEVLVTICFIWNKNFSPNLFHSIDYALKSKEHRVVKTLCSAMNLRIDSV